MAAPHSSRYPRPLKATHALSQTTPAAIAGAPAHPAHRFSHGSPSSSPTSPALGPIGGKRSAAPLSPDGPRSGVYRRGCVMDEERDSELDSSRRANSLTSLADPDCCYGNPLWQRPPQPNQLEVSHASNPGHMTSHSHKRSNSCSSADSMKKDSPSLPHSHKSDSCIHTRKSIEGLNQEISSVLEGKFFTHHQHPDGHIAPIRELLSSPQYHPPHPPAHSSPCHSPSPSPSPYPLSTPSPSLITPTELPETSAGFSLSYATDPHLPSSPNPLFAWEPPDGIERCQTLEQKPEIGASITPGPDRTKANIVFQGSAFLPTHRVVAFNYVS